MSIFHRLYLIIDVVEQQIGKTISHVEVVMVGGGGLADALDGQLDHLNPEKS
jgi:hypothetical protein